MRISLKVCGKEKSLVENDMILNLSAVKTNDIIKSKNLWEEFHMGIVYNEKKQGVQA